MKKLLRKLERHVAGMVLRAYFESPKGNFRESYWKRHKHINWLRWGNK